MDDDLDNLEAELMRLRPRALRPRFASRVDGDLGRPSPISGVWIWVSVPAAALFAAAALFWGHPSATPAAPMPASVADAAFKPVGIRDILVNSRDEGYVVLADGRTARRMIEAHVDTITWLNPRSAASIQWSVPRDELRIVPVVFR
jgi:hypothetical protein